MDSKAQWQRFRTYYCPCPEIGLALDISRMHFDEAFLDGMAIKMSLAYDAMDALERGAVANPDERRMVGHYWLRAPHLSPKPEIQDQINSAIRAAEAFAAAIHAGKIAPATRPKFRQVLLIGIGGSALGPMLLADALYHAGRPMGIHFLDNTDPDGIARVLGAQKEVLGETLCLVISKSGTTPETRNGMLLASEAYRSAGLEFPRHAAAITGAGSSLDTQAANEKWLARFPMWDFVGGRTSVTSPVGLVSAALLRADVEAFLAGAAACDDITRLRDTARNPAALLALMWHFATGGRGEKDMVVLPYSDRLALFPRYLQQLVMESLGKQTDLSGKRAEQGITVYGNKGSTDQHAYVQQLRDGVNNFFLTFIRVLENGGSRLEVEQNVTAGDYLHGFYLGTRTALSDNDRQSMTITLRRVDAFTLGALIALFERAVGFYASLVNINAYHQPGVEAGKKAATAALTLQVKLEKALSTDPRTAESLAAAIGRPEAVETVFALLEHLSANGRARVVTGETPDQMRFAKS